MKKALQFIAFLLVVAVVAGGACMLTRSVMHPRETPDAHAWVHQSLGITAEQEKALEPIEAKFAQRKAALGRQIRAANAELAQVILTDQQDSPRVDAAIDKIHAAQGGLQMETMAHVFAMKSALTPEQFEKLLQFTANALQANTGASH